MPPTHRVSSVTDALSEALRASESRYRRLFETAQDGILLLNADTAQIEDVNPYLIDLLGYSRAEFLGKKLWEVGAFADRTESKDLFAALQTTGYVRYEDLPLKTKAGARIEVEFVSNAYDSVGIKLIQCNIRDITERKKAEQALRTSEERLKTVFVQAPLGIALIDSLTGHIYESNPRFAEIAGRSMEEMVNIDWLQITHPDDVQADLDNMALLNTGKINRFQMEKRYLHPDGTAVWISMTIAPSKVEDKAHPRHLCMIQDITERKAAEGTIVHLNRVYAVLSGINSLIVRALNCDELFREACRIAVEAGGFRMAMIGIVDRSTMKVVPMASTGKDEALLTDIKCLLSSSEDAPKSMVAQVIREKKAVVSNDSLSDSRVLFGQKYAESGVRSMAVLPLIVADEAVGVLALYSSEIEFFQKEELKLLTELAGDIAFAIDHIGKQERLNYLAYYDALTGLANRSLFLERVAQYMRSAVSGGHKLALFLLDLERFKNINDSLGRPAGDALLKQVAEWLTYSTGDANLLARIDADHFALVIPEVRQDGDLARLAEKTMETFLEHPFHLNDAVFRIAAKVGIALFPDDAADADTLFRNAEAALKKAKASGDRSLFYTQKMTAAVARKLTLENQLRQALDNEEFAITSPRSTS
jgi:diguanylate cyclase (GGDEF)-like protein/PAS domain S-box-containing protein